MIEGASTIMPVQHLLYHKLADAFVGVAFKFFAILAFYFLGSAVSVSNSQPVNLNTHHTQGLKTTFGADCTPGRLSKFWKSFAVCNLV